MLVQRQFPKLRAEAQAPLSSFISFYSPPTFDLHPVHCEIQHKFPMEAFTSLSLVHSFISHALPKEASFSRSWKVLKNHPAFLEPKIGSARLRLFLSCVIQIKRFWTAHVQDHHVFTVKTYLRNSCCRATSRPFVSSDSIVMSRSLRSASTLSILSLSNSRNKLSRCNHKAIAFSIILKCYPPCNLLVHLPKQARKSCKLVIVTHFKAKT